MALTGQYIRQWKGMKEAFSGFFSLSICCVLDPHQVLVSRKENTLNWTLTETLLQKNIERGKNESFFFVFDNMLKSSCNYIVVCLKKKVAVVTL